MNWLKNERVDRSNYKIDLNNYFCHKDKNLRNLEFKLLGDEVFYYSK